MKRSSNFLIATLLITAASFVCAAQPAPRADLVIINANVRTMITPHSLAEAVAVKGDRIVAVGTNARIRRLSGPSTRVIDAGGRLVLPGFNDAHVHFIGIGNIFSSLDLRFASTPAEVTRRIASYVSVMPKGRWLLGSHLTVVPDAAAIDKISADTPVFIFRTDSTSAFVNRTALDLARIAHEDRDENGIVSGVAMSRLQRHIPEDHARRTRELAETATNYAASLGVTSVQDMHSDDLRDVLRELEREGKLKTRVYDCISLPDWRSLKTRDRVGMARGGCLKTFSNGEPESGRRILNDAVAADKAGFQIMVHAIGRSANAIALDAFQQIVVSNGRRDRRPRLEHAERPAVEDLDRIVRMDAIASVQPHLFDGTGLYRTLLDKRINVAFGSDAAMTDLDPLLGISAAVDAGPEAVTVYEAVRAYTLGSAYAEFQEREKGTIEAQKLADIIVLSDDIFALPKDAIRRPRVWMTITAGNIVYKNDT